MGMVIAYDGGQVAQRPESGEKPLSNHAVVVGACPVQLTNQFFVDSGGGYAAIMEQARVKEVDDALFAPVQPDGTPFGHIGDTLAVLTIIDTDKAQRLRQGADRTMQIYF
jgi:hypothetical protein